MPDGANRTPSLPLREDEEIRRSFHPDRNAYLRDNAWLAAGAMGLGMLILWLMGNPHVWTGAVGGLAAIGLRAWYLASEELSVRWDLTDFRLMGPGGRAIRLADISRVRVLASTVQIVTASGDKHLMKYQKDRDATADAIRRAALAAGGKPT